MKLKMKTSLSGPEFTLSPGDVHPFEDADEAQRLIGAGFAEEFVEESDEDTLERLEQEVAALRVKLGKDKKEEKDVGDGAVTPPAVPPAAEPAAPPPAPKPAAAKPAKPAKA